MLTRCHTELLAILLLSLIAFLSINPVGCDVVRTLKNKLQLRGQTQRIQLDNNHRVDVDVFTGIPYAEAPVGRLRFARPEPHRGWKGILDATHLPPSCYQGDPSEFELKNPAARMWLANTNMSEDCLFLNIWQPSIKGQEPPKTTTADKKPVMIWIYGGGFTLGTSTLDVYNASILAAKENVVVVSMQYRLGPFGMLRMSPFTGPSFTSDESNKIALGNQAFFDMLLAIKWTAANIDSFGGDPKQMTIFGESAGSVSASLLWLSPIANRYFNRAILQSGSIFTRWGFSDHADADDRAAKFAEASKCPVPSQGRRASLECLQKLSPEQVVANSFKVLDKLGQERYNLFAEHVVKNSQISRSELEATYPSGNLYFDVPFKAVVDGTLLPRHPRQLFAEMARNRSHRVPDLLAGVNANEGSYFLLYGLQIGTASFFNQDQGLVQLPEEVKLTASRHPLPKGGALVDLYLLTASQFIDTKTFKSDDVASSLAALPALEYALPSQKLTSAEHFATDNAYSSPSQLPISAEELLARLDRLSSDLDFVCPTLEFVDRAARLTTDDRSVRVFLYEFNRRTKSLPMPEWLGVMHGYEIEYVFGMPRSKIFQGKFYNFTEEERQLSDQMMNMWTNFAKTGDPNSINGPNVLKWPRYIPRHNRSDIKRADTELHIKLDTQLSIGQSLRRDGCNFWLQQMRLLKRLATSDVDSYRLFVPWCSESVVVRRDSPNSAMVRLGVGFPPLNESYTSTVTTKECESVKVSPTVTSSLVIARRVGNLLLVGLNRPSLGNAFDQDIGGELESVLHSQFESDPDVKAGVLYGEGSDFCVGQNLSGSGDVASSSNTKKNIGADCKVPNSIDLISSIEPHRLNLRPPSKPLLAAIHGRAIGVGLELALACDLRIAEQGSMLGLVKRKLCLPMSGMSANRLRSLIGLSHALDLTLTGRPIDVDEAYRIGLVNRITKTGTALGVAVKLAQNLANLPRQRKLLTDRANLLALDESVARENIFSASEDLCKQNK